MVKPATKKREVTRKQEGARPRRAKLSEAETLKRMETFDERKEEFIASIRKGKG